MQSLVMLAAHRGPAVEGCEFWPGNVWAGVNSKRVWAALWLPFRPAFLVAVFNPVFGVILSWVPVCYRFAGWHLADAAVNLPFALPTTAAGIALTALYASNGILGGGRADRLEDRPDPMGHLSGTGLRGLPFVTGTVQPVVEEIDAEVEEASATLGAGRLHTLRHVIAPMLMPAMLTGFALSLARSVDSGQIRIGDHDRGQHPPADGNRAPADRRSA